MIKSESSMSDDAESIAITERKNSQAAKIDTFSSLEIVTLINNEDVKVAPAVGKELPQIARAVDIIVERLSQGGRLLYFGAGTSGRLGVLDASEILPTYGVPPEQVQGFIAGGDVALRQSVGEAEDDRAAGERLIDQLGVSEIDVVVGIAASGSTPWVLGVVDEANRRGAATIALACNPGTPLAQLEWRLPLWLARRSLLDLAE